MRGVWAPRWVLVVVLTVVAVMGSVVAVPGAALAGPRPTKLPKPRVSLTASSVVVAPGDRVRLRAEVRGGVPRAKVVLLRSMGGKKFTRVKVKRLPERVDARKVVAFRVRVPDAGNVRYRVKVQRAGVIRTATSKPVRVRVAPVLPVPPPPLPPQLPEQPEPPEPPAPAVARVEVDGGGVFVPGVGRTAELRATAFDENDVPVEVDPSQVVWSSADPSVVAVDGQGLATGVAVGVTKVTAAVGGVRSADGVAIVSELPAGTVVIGDEHILEVPAPLLEEGEEFTFDSLLEGVFVDLPTVPQVGDLVVSTGLIPVVGRVVTVADLGDGLTRLVLEQVALPEVVGDLPVVTETFDLSGGGFEPSVGIEEHFDVSRQGDKWTFTPKSVPAGDAPLVGPQSASVQGSRAAAANALSDGCSRADAGSPLVCTFFDKALTCEVTGTGVTTSPIQLSVPPVVSLKLSPTLDLTSRPGESRRVVVGAHPQVTFEVKLGLELSVGMKASCKLELGKPNIPLPGPLAAFALVVPVGVGFEVAPEVTLAEASVGFKASAGFSMQAGFVCYTGGDCSSVLDAEQDEPTFEPTFDGLDPLADLRLVLGMSAFGYADVKFGPRSLPAVARRWLGTAAEEALDAARIEIGGVRVGPSLTANLAPRQVQVADTDYASSMEASLPLTFSLGAKLGEVARFLGVGELTAFEATPVEIALDRTPVGTLTAVKTQADPVLDDGDVATMDLGDRYRFTASIANPPGVDQVFDDPGTFLGLFGIDEVLLVDVDGEVISRQAGVEGQLTYHFDLEVVPELNATNGNDQIRFGPLDEVYLFFTTTLPLDLWGFELAQATPGTAEAMYYAIPPGPDGEVRVVALPDGGAEPIEIDLHGVGGGGPVQDVRLHGVSTDGTRMLLSIEGAAEPRSLWVVDRRAQTSRKLSFDPALMCTYFQLAELAPSGDIGFVRLRPAPEQGCDERVMFSLDPIPEGGSCADTPVPHGTGPDCAAPVRGDSFGMLDALPSASGRYLYRYSYGLFDPDHGEWGDTVGIVATDVVTGEETMIAQLSGCTVTSCAGKPFEGVLSGPIDVLASLPDEDGVLAIWEEYTGVRVPPSHNTMEIERTLSVVKIRMDGSVEPLPGVSYNCAISGAVDTIEAHQCVQTNGFTGWYGLNIGFQFRTIVSPDGKRFMTVWFDFPEPDSLRFYTLGGDTPVPEDHPPFVGEQTLALDAAGLHGWGTSFGVFWRALW